MKKIISIIAMCALAAPAVALTPAGQGRRSMSNQMMSAPRATASTNQISATAAVTNGNISVSTTPSAQIGQTAQTAQASQSSVRVDSEIPIEIVVDTREKERVACLNNNIGIGNTFVWASRYSNVNNYASMVEDVENPENNVCFVKVEIKSDDSKINVSDVPSQYFVFGQDITCGSWADEGKIKSRILSAKKSARTWGTVGGAVGGAGVGVGIMELFGNRIIGGKVMGQKNKNLSEDQVLRSQLLAISDTSEFKDMMRYARTLRDECENDIWTQGDADRPDECDEIDYEFILSIK